MGPIDARVIRESLGRWGDVTDALCAVLRDSDTRSDALEASVRHRAGAFVGHRMMIEGVDAATALAVLNVLGFDLQESPFAERVARAPELLAIAGWDAGGAELVGKLYLNGSDASAAVRAELARAFGLPAEAGAPHLIGFNLLRGGTGLAIETKIYDQWASLAECADDDVPPFLADWLGAAVPAGLVRSRVVDDGKISTKAWFVAPRANDVAEILTRVSGFDGDRARTCVPFKTGVLKSIGGPPDGSSWTLYFKPEGAGDAPHALDPVACFGTEEGEVGLYVAPNEGTPRAYVRTAHHALSYRVREGQPASGEIEALMTWAETRVRACEETSPVELSAIDLRQPPAPWCPRDH